MIFVCGKNHSFLSFLSLFHQEAINKQNMAIRLQLESALAENRQLRFVLQQQQQLGMAAAAAGPSSGGTANAMPPHAMMLPNPLMMDPTTVAFLLSNATMGGQLGQQGLQQFPQGQNPMLQGNNMQGNNTMTATANTQAIAQLLVNQRATAGATASVSDTRSISSTQSD